MGKATSMSRLGKMIFLRSSLWCAPFFHRCSLILLLVPCCNPYGPINFFISHLLLLIPSPLVLSFPRTTGNISIEP
ncbi:hypothetical protein C8J55DRAFT_262504 [Lentinula edodes]|uniref:Uncharacterized protein n=1 Tax=Lentinula lateritia TaxID=40482 RepID=A0A9W8ZRZ9_9AGAR|nr:hypothetical protein C8J55DRAFT_262504 [Lentinula edodes]